MANIEHLKIGRQNTAEERKLQEQLWRDFIERQKESGMTQVDFCRQHSIPPHRFVYWKHEILVRDGKLKPKSKKKKSRSTTNHAKPTLVPVKIEPKKKSSNSFSQNNFEIVLSNNRIVRVPQKFDGKSLLQLLSVLEN